MESPSAAYYDPPTFHEVCKCEECHENSEHIDDIEYWSKKGCSSCYDENVTIVH